MAAMFAHIAAVALIFGTFLILTDGACKEYAKLTTEEKAMLDAHNKLRAKHKDTENLCYGESGSDVTFTATEVANIQGGQHSTGKTFGENIGSRGNDKGYKPQNEVFAAELQSWYDEKNSDEHKQIIWKSSKQVNCGYRSYTMTGDIYTGFKKFYFGKVVCQYYPPGNKKAGAQNIGEEAANLGDLIPVPCPKPTVQNGKVTPDTATVNPGEKFTVTCNEGYILEKANAQTCNVDGTLSPASLTCNLKPAPPPSDGGKGGSSKAAPLLSLLFLVVQIFLH